MTIQSLPAQCSSSDVTETDTYLLLSLSAISSQTASAASLISADLLTAAVSSNHLLTSQRSPLSAAISLTSSCLITRLPYASATLVSLKAREELIPWVAAGSASALLVLRLADINSRHQLTKRGGSVLASLLFGCNQIYSLQQTQQQLGF